MALDMASSDPLSPSIFILGGEFLSRTLNNLLMTNDNFTPFSMHKRGPQINHLAYANDIVIFSSGNSKSVKLIMKQEYISNGNWNMDKLKDVLPDNIVHHIGNISIGDENHSDYVIWNLTQDGLYSNISAWQIIREAAISTALPNCDTTGTWAEFCARIERYKPIVRWRQVRWMKPEIGKINANTDGSFINENSRVGIGGIIRDATGNLIMAFSVPA
ncbi:hypothetical protein MTR67_022147 [Solanum verrucosum]|uniref:RNase H type-1 domain-containing protein n=1 Tax=Solanum verrucosum TaxID=315347 RepID=A0AAF0TQA2_SOLVR|nr:hypothetical protein MTR67_022147 [Solanum verrucosum]